MFTVLAIQVMLGIFTILNRVPVTLAASHQGVALLLFAASLFCLAPVARGGAGC